MKRGMSHIEVILSFILFVGIVATAFYFFRPAPNYSFEESLAEHIANSIEKESSIDIERMFVALGEGHDFTTNPIVSFPVDIDEDKGVIAVSGDDSLPASFDFNNKIVSVGTNGNQPFEIIFSDAFADEEINGAEPIIDYQLGTYRTEKLLFKKKLQDLTLMEYNSLKERLGIPNVRDFSFKLVVDGEVCVEGEACDNIELVEKEPSLGINVFSYSKRVEFIDEDGRQDFGQLEVRVW